MTAIAAPRRLTHDPRAQSDRLSAVAAMHERLFFLVALFVAAGGVIAIRLVWLAVLGAPITTAPAADVTRRADIVDRNGQVLARTIDAWSIGVHPARLLGSPADLAPKLAMLMPERSEAEYRAILSSKVRFTYLRRRALPDLVAKVNALGEPGIAYAREPERLYPQATLAAHVLGFADQDGHGVAGMERVLHDRLSGADAAPVALALDARVQAAVESELAAVVADQQAVGATGVVLDVRTGEVVAMASLPVFNPNRPGAGADETRRNNVTQSVYELGSTFKAFTAAAAIDAGIVPSMDKRYDATAPLKVGGFAINDDHPAKRWLNVPEMLVHSSNIVTARIADELGEARTAALYRKLHFDAAPAIELREKGSPIWPSYWGRTTVMTIGYGHGMAVTPLHLANGYAALVNGGIYRPATLLKRKPSDVPVGERVFSEGTSNRMRQLLRLIVTEGTGKKADADGLRVGGKTGTAEKASGGGYAKSSIVATFAAAFPMDAPRYVIVAMVDEPRGSAASAGQRTAGWVVAPAVKRIVSRIGPLLGVFPDAGRDVDTSELTPLIWKSKGR